jgi:predicted Zn finger-like uncharacterized protein
MASLLTQCPHCQTSFRVRTSQLAVAEGQVRCGSCLGVFSARDNEIRVKTPQPPLLDEPLTEEELSSVAAADLEETADADNTPPPRERSGSWLDDDDDEYEYQDDTQRSTPLVHAAAEEADEDEIREEYAGEDYHDAYAKEYEDEPVLREPVLSFAAVDESEEYEDEDEEIEDEETDEEDEVHEEYADDEDEEYADEDDRNEPVLREPVLSFADDEPRFSTRAAKAEPDFSLYPDQDHAEPTFSAVDDDDDDEGDDYRQVRSRYAAPSREDDKRQVRRYVEEIEDEEALDELSPNTLDYLDDEPVHIAPERRKRGFFGSLMLFVGSLILMGVAALQMVDANLDTISQSARFALLRPYVCQVLTCPPEQQAPSTLSYEQLVVRAHPKVRDALEVSAVLRNNGAATQALPGLEVTFRDGKNEIVGSRIFTPDEYLPAELRTAVTLPSQSTVQAHMEMADPGVDTLNYELALRPLSAPIKR